MLRQRVTTDIATKGGQFDVMTIGMHETPISGKKGCLVGLVVFTRGGLGGSAWTSEPNCRAVPS